MESHFDGSLYTSNSYSRSHFSIRIYRYFLLVSSPAYSVLSFEFMIAVCVCGCVCDCVCVAVCVCVVLWFLLVISRISIPDLNETTTKTEHGIYVNELYHSISNYSTLDTSIKLPNRIQQIYGQFRSLRLFLFAQQQQHQQKKHIFSMYAILMSSRIYFLLDCIEHVAWSRIHNDNSLYPIAWLSA